MVDSGYITKRGEYYQITDDGKDILEFSVGRLRIHNIWIKYRIKTELEKLIKILEKLRIEGKAKRTTVNNWRRYELELDVGDFKAKVWINVAPEQLTVVFFDLPEFKASNLNKAYIKCYNDGLKCRKALLEQFGIDTYEEVEDIDFIPEVISAEYAERLPDFLPLTNYEVRLGYPAKDLQGKDLDVEARALIDRSKGYWERETNDAQYAEDVILEPIRVKNIEIKVDVIDEKIDKLESLLFGSDGFLTKVTTTLQAFAEANEKFAINSNTHLQYMIEAKEVMSKMNQTMNGLNELINQLNSTVASIVQLQLRKRSNGSSSSQKKQDKRVRYVSWVRIPKGRD